MSIIHSAWSRGFHVYMKSTWPKPDLSDKLKVQLDKDNNDDPFVVAVFKINNTKGKSASREVVGHCPREISRHVHFIKLGGKVVVSVHDVKFHKSLTALKGLEILLNASFRISGAIKFAVLERLKDHIESNYKTPVRIIGAEEDAANKSSGKTDEMETGAKVDGNSSNDATASGAEAASNSLDKDNEGVVRNSPGKVEKVFYYRISDDSSSDCSDL